MCVCLCCKLYTQLVDYYYYNYGYVPTVSIQNKLLLLLAYCT